MAKISLLGFTLSYNDHCTQPISIEHGGIFFPIQSGAD